MFFYGLEKKQWRFSVASNYKVKIESATVRLSITLSSYSGRFREYGWRLAGKSCKEEREGNLSSVGIDSYNLKLQNSLNMFPSCFVLPKLTIPPVKDQNRKVFPPRTAINLALVYFGGTLQTHLSENTINVTKVVMATKANVQ